MSAVAVGPLAGGGYSYYTQCVSGLVGSAAAQGIEATTIQQYLHDFPVDPNDIVHVRMHWGRVGCAHRCVVVLTRLPC